MSHSLPSVYVIDDKPSVRNALTRLFRSAGRVAIGFESADEFLVSDFPVTSAACVVSDIRMPGTQGTDLPSILRERGLSIPVILITGFDSAETREQAKTAGAVGYFRKPIDDQALLDAVEWALQKSN